MVLLRVKADVGPDNTVTVELPPAVKTEQVTVTIEPADWTWEPEFRPRNEREEAIWREQEAYIRLHPALVRSHLNQYVAIMDRAVVDSSKDRTSIWNRMEATYPDRLFYITRVQSMAIPVLRIRSPRVTRS